MLMIRLSRTGRNNLPAYSLVVTEKTNPAKGGNFLEKVGYFDTLQKDAKLQFEKDRVLHWISKGARPSETVARLLRQQGVEGMEKFVDVNKKYQKKSKKDQPEQAEAKPEAAVAPAEPKKEEAAVAPAEPKKEEAAVAPAEPKKEEAAVAPADKPEDAAVVAADKPETETKPEPEADTPAAEAANG
ncbi:MAG: 30S ribosomal protein S16 [bacterium]|nr:30S ribosomal protein S16 [bacterium]